MLRRFTVLSWITRFKKFYIITTALAMEDSTQLNYPTSVRTLDMQRMLAVTKAFFVPKV